MLSLVADKITPAGEEIGASTAWGGDRRIIVGPAIAERARDERLRALLAYWRQRAGERAMPARRDFDPADFVSLLGVVALVDVLHDPLRFRYRLVGTKLVERIGREMTGHWVSDIPRPQLRQVTRKDYELVVRRREPVLFQGDDISDTRRTGYEILRLPLSGDGAVIDMILTAALYCED